MLAALLAHLETGEPLAGLAVNPGKAIIVSEEARALSPLFQIRKSLPPMLVLHGLDDTVVIPEQSHKFCAAMRAAGNRCDLSLYDGTRHAFVVTGYTAPETTVVRAICDGDRFLVSLGILHGEPSLQITPH